VAVTGVTTAKAVSVGTSYACALLSNGTIYCWGDNADGQLGNGSSAGPDSCGGVACSTTPTQVSGITNAIAVSAGASQTCAVLASGDVDCWGTNWAGELGPTNTVPYSTTPVSLGFANATSVSAGNDFSCALLATGIIDCWGDNEYGQLGNGTTGSQTDTGTAVQVSGITNAIAISAAAWDSAHHACALLMTGTAACWGSDLSGELGNGTTEMESSTPVAVSGLSDATGIAAGNSDGCALLSPGTINCWGDDGSGELGNGSTGGDYSSPVAVSAINNATFVSPAFEYTCAVLSSGGIDCWGTNDLGQLGDGTTTPTNVPGPVTGIP